MPRVVRSTGVTDAAGGTLSRMTTIIRASAAHDLLALVPSLAGFVPERSIVCVAFRGARSAGVLRHDLPRRAKDRAALVTAVIGTLCRMPGVDAVVPIAYTDATFATGGVMPERRLLSLLVRRAEQAGFAVRDALCRAADGWGSLLDADTPATGHPLAMIDASPAAAQLPAEDRVHDTADAGGRLPVPDETVAADIATELAAFAEIGRIVGQLDRLGDDADPVALAETLLRARPDEHPPLRMAWFVHLADRPAIRDAMMLQFAFGPVVGEAAHDDAAETASRAADRGETVDELVRREVADGDEDPVSELLGRLLLGQSSLRPDHPRVERALELCRWAAAHAPAELRPAPLCIAAWQAWALGRGSAAGALIDQALAVAPGHPMAALLSAFIGSGVLPEWAFAHRPSDAAERSGGVTLNDR